MKLHLTSNDLVNSDLHIHSCLSPCADMDMTPANIVGMAKVAGLDTIALTDHNSILNIEAAMKVGEVYGVRVIPGMEVETAEEIHILTLYPTLEAAQSVYDAVYGSMLDIPNRPDLYGEQAIVNEDDEIIGYEKKLLLQACALTVDELFECVSSVGGLFIPAHVDRHNYSILTNLGAIPEDLAIEYIELSTRVEDVEDYLNSRPTLKRYKIIKNSDAHYLENIGTNK